MMKFHFLIIINLIISNYSTVFSQIEYKPNAALDVYGMDIIFKNKILTDKCDCCCNLNFKTKDCNLYEVEIKEVFLQRDSSVFKNEEEVKGIKNLIIPTSFHYTKDIKLENKRYTGFAYSSCSKDILVLTQLFENRPEFISNYSGLAFVSGLAICRKLNFWQKHSFFWAGGNSIK